MRRAQWLEQLLPWYVNGTLGARERRRIERYLQAEGPASAAARAQLEAWQAIQAAVQAEEPGAAPSARLRGCVLGAVHARAVQRPAASRLRAGVRRLTLAAGALAALLALVVLWSALQPGVVLQWSVTAGTPTAFQVYRAPLGARELRPVAKVAARPEAREYIFRDARLVALGRYVYRVEGIAPDGSAIPSPTITVNALEALPAQAAVLLASLLAGWGAAAALARAGIGRTLGVC